MGLDTNLVLGLVDAYIAVLPAAEDDGAAAGLQRTGDDVAERALAGAVFTGQHVDLARLDRHVNAFEDFDRAKGLADAFEFQNCIQRALPPYRSFTSDTQVNDR